METKAKKIIIKAANRISTLKACITMGGEVSAQNMWRGVIEGLLEAASIITGQVYTWDNNGIYENHGNEPIIKA